jgi:hypothetical protein
VLALTDFEGDDSGRLEDALNRELARLAGSMPIEIRHVDATLAPELAGQAPGSLSRLEAVENMRRVGAGFILWGSVEHRGGKAIAQLYESSWVEGAQFGETHKPRDFALPQLPIEQLGPIVTLIAAAQMARLGIATSPRARAALASAIAPVERLADANCGAADWREMPARGRTSSSPRRCTSRGS